MASRPPAAPRTAITFTTALTPTAASPRTHCAGRPPGAAVIPVFYATDRNREPERPLITDQAVPGRQAVDGTVRRGHPP